MLLFGDFCNFYIVDWVGMIMVYELLVKGSNGWLMGEVGWFVYWCVGLDVVNVDVFCFLNVI